jgi:Phosphotransferase enzyme family
MGTAFSMPNSESDRLNSRSSGQAKRPSASQSHSPDSSVYLDSKGTKVRVLSKQGGAIVQQLNDGKVVKFGDRVKPSEVAAMKLVLQDTDIPLPDFIHQEFDHQRGIGYLWMEFIPGSRLDSLWKNLDDALKQRVCQDTWDIITKIRKIPRPPKYQRLFQCTADGSTSKDPLLEDLKEPPRPLLNDTALRERIYERYLHYAGRRYAKQLPDMLPRSSSSVFTHGDIAPRNIMVDKDLHITGILDWERAGWYPHYWEYANIMGPAGICGDWQKWMDDTGPQNFKCNLAGINAARRVLF